jgi:hypothetical protein
VKRYFAEIDAFNGFVITDNRGDEEANAMAEATYEATRERMIGVPARSAEDALAAMDWLTKEGVDFETELGDDGPHEQVVTSLVDAIRNYIVSTAGRQV